MSNPNHAAYLNPSPDPEPSPDPNVDPNPLLHPQGAGWGFGADAYEVKEADDPLEELSFEALYSQAKEKGLNMTSKQSRLVEQLEK